MRDTTDRPEAVDAGMVHLVSTDVAKIVDAVTRLLTDKNEYLAMCRAHNPYRDGHACQRILVTLKNHQVILFWLSSWVISVCQRRQRLLPTGRKWWA